MTKIEKYKNLQRKKAKRLKRTLTAKSKSEQKRLAFLKQKEIEHQGLLALGPKDYSPTPEEKEILDARKKKQDEKKKEQLAKWKPNRSDRRKIL